MPDDPRDKFKAKTPPQNVAEALTVPPDFASGSRERDQITGVGLPPLAEANARIQRLQSTTDGSATTITSQLAEHTLQIIDLKAGLEEVKSDVGEIKLSTSETAIAMPMLTKAVQDLTTAAIQRETTTRIRHVEIDTAEQIAQIETQKEEKISVIETTKELRKARIERGKNIWAIAATILALALALVEALR